MKESELIKQFDNIQIKISVISWSENIVLFGCDNRKNINEVRKILNWLGFKTGKAYRSFIDDLVYLPAYLEG